MMPGPGAGPDPVPIRETGGFLPLDAEGYIVNEASVARIGKPWAAALAAITEACVRSYGRKLHSVYVRGSVATGQAVAGCSDVDAVVLLRHRLWDRHVRLARPAWESELEHDLQTRCPFVNGVELAVASYDLTFQERNDPLPMLLKTQSACIHGTDVIPFLPRFRPGVEMMYYNGRIKHFLAQLLDDGALPADARGVRKVCQSLTKAFLRCGFELVMEREGTYTRDLYPSYRSFSRHHPDQEPDMRRALELFLNPPSDLGPLTALASTLGRWLAETERAVDIRPSPTFARRLGARLLDSSPGSRLPRPGRGDRGEGPAALNPPPSSGAPGTTP